MIQVEGKNPVYEALRARRVLRLKIAREVEKEQKIQLIFDLSNVSFVPIDFTSMAELERISKTGHHQGVIAYVKPSQIRSLKTIVVKMKNDLCLLLLERLQDPQNLGAILRTAESTGISAVVIPKRKSVSLTPAVHRASMGGSLYVPLFRENFSSVLKILQDEGIRVIGVDPSGSTEYFSENLIGAVAFVLGGEDSGISPVLLRKCNSIVRIPMRGRIESLNVSVSAALVLYERLRQQIHKDTIGESSRKR